jgi:menaquinone-specific isochorismate synthase
LACEQIQELEPFERSLYAAPIGWVDHAGNGEFAVGIRSALIHGNRARLFAGAGIVAGSNPDKEFAEVQLKLQALLNALA